MTERYLFPATLKIEGAFGQYDTSWGPPPSKAELAAAKQKEAKRQASLTPFAKRWASRLNPDGYYYEVSHEELINDIMLIEKALRRELKRDG